MFAYDEQSLQAEYSLTPTEVEALSDLDLLEMYDTTLLTFER